MVWAKETTMNKEKKDTLLNAIYKSELKQLQGHDQVQYIIDAMRGAYGGYWSVSAGEPTEHFAYHSNVSGFRAEFYYAEKQWRIEKSCD